MKRLKRTVFCIALIISLIASTVSAYAYSSYVGGLSTLTGSDQLTQAAYDCFSAKGYNPEIRVFTFSKSSVQAAMTSALCFYVDTHGSSSSFSTNDGSCSSGELNSWRAGTYFRFVFIDACNSATSTDLANSFGIANGDGSSHAYLGWVNYSYTSDPYLNYTKYVFSLMRSGYSVYNANYLASQAYNIGNSRIYGSPNTTL